MLAGLAGCEAPLEALTLAGVGGEGDWEALSGLPHLRVLRLLDCEWRSAYDKYPARGAAPPKVAPVTRGLARVLGDLNALERLLVNGVRVLRVEDLEPRRGARVPRLDFVETHLATPELDEADGDDEEELPEIDDPDFDEKLARLDERDELRRVEREARQSEWRRLALAELFPEIEVTLNEESDPSWEHR